MTTRNTIFFLCLKCRIFVIIFIFCVYLLLAPAAGEPGHYGDVEEGLVGEGLHVPSHQEVVGGDQQRGPAGQLLHAEAPAPRPAPAPVHGAEPGVPGGGVHQPHGVAGVMEVEVEGDTPHHHQSEGQLHYLWREFFVHNVKLSANAHDICYAHSSS